MWSKSSPEGMWIRSSRGKTSKPLGVKWPSEPIKALGIYYSYNFKLCTKKILLRDWTVSNKPINLWSSRGLSIYVKVTIIKSLIIPKFVYISSLLSVSKEIVKEIVKELNQMIFKFLWKGTDKVTKLSTINGI